MYKITSTGNTINATTTKILSSRNSSYASRYRMVYNGSAWHSVAETNATYTFVLGNTTSRFSATKGIIDNNSSIKLSPSNFDPAINTDADQIKEFLKMFSNKYSIAGATFKLTNLTTNEVVGTWTSTTEAQSYILTRGDYIFEEIDAPNGKALNLGIKFTVKEADGTLKAFYTDTNEELSYITDESGVVRYQLSIVDPDLTKLPTAGGKGTLPFTCAGITIMLAGIAVLKKKRRAIE